MKILIIGMLMTSIVLISGCTEKTDNSLKEGKIVGTTMEIASGNHTYPAYLSAPAGEGKNLLWC